MEGFFRDLPVLNQFSQVCDFSSYIELPEDWHIIVADVVNSTKAVRSGRYRAVNITGVSVISSILNIATPMQIPYIFGGDYHFVDGANGGYALAATEMKRQIKTLATIHTTIL